ncbi:External alternative NAD(P)H-ubiquinone oxidoreductase B3, mitochondrial [Morella rubra]|uniref:NADH:ubiquinone reductase (non-electrogenic) n=1 Tax=Morella rubra TaxID=262757 RepID=A0A6A1W9E0_9ROSI|nr:External alternative NAD(P)H-ubiquinone oxidoreductase B3, mitochondrial [Morella rubra]
MRMLPLYERVSGAFHDHPSLSKLLVLFTVSGGGLLAYAEANPGSGAYTIASSESERKKKKVVVLGTGWAGTSFLKNLKNPSYDVQVVSPRNYFAFTPLLPSVTVGTVEARSIVEPIRNIVRKRSFHIHTFFDGGVIGKERGQGEEAKKTDKTRWWKNDASNFARGLQAILSASSAYGFGKELDTSVASGKKNVDVHYWEADCYKIDAANKKIYCRATQKNNSNEIEEFVVDYDFLVIAVGARVNTFNTPGVEENCHFLKEVEDAQNIRRAVIDCFERASLPTVSDEEKKRILHFAVVGGGPTGVEFAAELHDFVNEDLVKLYPGVKELVKITLLEAGDHILNMFDKRITAFAEKKFKREGINLKTGSMVVKVTDKEISTKEMKTGELSSIPYGMAVWSTGIGTRPVIMDFMKQIGQARRVLATDEWLRVEGCDNIYAMGDCATINQRKVMEDISAIFNKADKDNSGTLTVKEFQEVIDDICTRYPQVELYLKKKQMRNIVDLLTASKGDVAKESIELNIEEVKSLLSEVDSQMKNVPATAQVAAQQGTYLADCFNRMEECEQNPEGPLRFRGMGRHRFQPFSIIQDLQAQWYLHDCGLTALGGESHMRSSHSYGSPSAQFFTTTASKSAGATGYWWCQTGQSVLFLGGTQVAYEAGTAKLY